MRLNIKMKEIDNDALTIGPRCCVIDTPKGRFETPSRALSSQEAGPFLKTSLTLMPLVNPIYEHYYTLSLKDIRELMSMNGKMKSLVSKISEIKSKHDEKLSMFYPIRKNKEIGLEDKDIRTLIDLQYLSGFDLITVPDYWPHGCGVKEILKKYEKLKNEIENNLDTFLVPYIRLNRNLDEFETLLHALVKMEIPIVGLEYYSPLDNYYPNLRELRKISINSEHTVFHMSKVSPRYGRSKVKLSNLHALGLFGIDTVSRGVPAAGGGTQKIESIRRFTPKSLGVLDKREYAQDEMYDAKDCNCPICNGQTVSEFYENYSKRPNGKKKSPPFLASVSKVHEAFSSYEEFKKTVKHIHKNRYMEEYVPSKAYLSSYAKSVS
jgi:hypothetical protein